MIIIIIFIHWPRLVKNIGLEIQNIGGQKKKVGAEGKK